MSNEKCSPPPETVGKYDRYRTAHIDLTDDEVRRLKGNYVVVQSGCWEWLGYKNQYGYGRMHVRRNGRKYTLQAHRLMYQVNFGALPEGAVVMHTCDNPGCLNPAHLQLGTQAQNMADKIAKGRGRNGRSHNGEARIVDGVLTWVEHD